VNDKNFDLLFRARERGSKAWMDKFTDALAACDIDTMHMLINQGSEEYSDRYFIKTAIDSSTLKETEPSKKKEMFDWLCSDEAKFVKSYKIDSDKTELVLPDGRIITYGPISDIFKKDDELEQIYTTDARYKQCHTHSYRLSYALANNKRRKVENEVVTGYIHSVSAVNRYLHSWLECDGSIGEIESLKTSGGGSLVLDSTLNIVMDRAGYYWLRAVDEKTLTRISGRELTEDRRTFFSELDSVNEKFSIKTYLTARHEIRRDLDKNRQLFREKDC
jgi:hypothetical protein